MLAPARAPRPPRRAPSQSLAAALGIGDEGRHRWDTAAALPTAVPPSIYPLCRPVAALVQEAHQSYWKGSSRLGQQRLRLEWLDGEEKLRVDDNGSIYSKSGAGGIEYGARRPELEKMMPISKLAAPLARFLWGFRRGGRRDEDGTVARP